jgi:hypothetical protein
VPASPGAAARANRLEGQIDAAAREAGTTVRRYRDAFNRKMLLLALQHAIERAVLDDYHLKGGVAIEMRRGFSARSTTDLDIELPYAIDELTAVFNAAITVGCGDFTFELLPDVRPIREDAVRVSVAMKYLGRRWARIEVDLASAQPGDVADHLPLIVVEFPDVAGVARTMKTEYQIAQKIHAATTPDRPDYQFNYARHVVDVLYLAGEGPDFFAIRAACQAVFDARSATDGRAWPPIVELPKRWIAEYGVTLNAYNIDFPAEDVPRAFMSLLATIIEGEPPMPGFEYQFVSLAVRPTDSVFAESVETGGAQYEHFRQLTANGWRVRSTCAHPRGAPYIVILLEREIMPEPAT